MQTRWSFGPWMVIAAFTLLSGCERRVEEPIPEARPLDPTSVGVQGSADRVVSPLGAQNRCVRETPAKPTRLAPKGPDSRCPTDPEVPPLLRRGKVTFSDAKATTVDVEIAENDHDRQRGLMFRRSMPDAQGMIFRFDRREDHAFWMHNTCISLDMLYIDDDGLIVGIQENTPTMSDETFSVGCPSTFVLELNAGWTRSHGIVAGQKVKLEGI